MASQTCNYSKVIKSVNALVEERHLSRSELAFKLGVSASLVSQKLNGRASFTLKDIIKIADLFSVSTDWLLGRESMEVKQ
ncbi:MAG: helix-turn-helix domain-containing protein [Bifidobacterium sp.]|jgi:transcriptional regulator with XRE-family HTH domain|nr:helix-turn-helix domain-containing protein [Bifidobacterium sp.]